MKDTAPIPVTRPEDRTDTAQQPRIPAARTGMSHTDHVALRREHRRAERMTRVEQYARLTMWASIVLLCILAVAEVTGPVAYAAVLLLAGSATIAVAAKMRRSIRIMDRAIGRRH